MTNYSISIYRIEPTGVPGTQMFTTARNSINDDEQLAEVLERLEKGFPAKEFEIRIFEHFSNTKELR